MQVKVSWLMQESLAPRSSYGHHELVLIINVPVTSDSGPPPANAMSIQGGLGQATRFLVFLKEIKAKSFWGLV